MSPLLRAGLAAWSGLDRLGPRWTQDPTTTTTTLPPPPEVDFTLGNVAVALLRASIFAIPLGISLWALLDAARRPRWAWALAGRRQVVWMALIMAGVLSVIGGLFISGWYLTRVRPRIADVEGGAI